MDIIIYYTRLGIGILDLDTIFWFPYDIRHLLGILSFWFWLSDFDNFRTRSSDQFWIQIFFGYSSFYRTNFICIFGFLTRFFGFRSISCPYNDQNYFTLFTIISRSRISGTILDFNDDIWVLGILTWLFESEFEFDFFSDQKK